MSWERLALMSVSLVVSTWLACRTGRRSLLNGSLVLWFAAGAVLFCRSGLPCAEPHLALWTLMGWPAALVYCGFAAETRRMVAGLARGARRPLPAPRSRF